MLLTAKQGNGITLYVGYGLKEYTVDVLKNATGTKG